MSSWPTLTKARLKLSWHGRRVRISGVFSQTPLFKIVLLGKEGGFRLIAPLLRPRRLGGTSRSLCNRVSVHRVVEPEGGFNFPRVHSHRLTVAGKRGGMSVLLRKDRQKGRVTSKHLSSCWQRGFGVGLPWKEGGAARWKRKWVKASTVHLVGKSGPRNNSRILVCVP